MSNETVSKPKNGLSFKSKLLLTASSIISGIACRSDGTVNRRLLNLADLHTPPSDTPINGVSTYDFTIDASRQLWFRLFVPVHDSSDHLPVIIFFHGGGFVHYSPSTTPFDTLCRRIAGDSHAVVISVNYRLAPEHKFPAQYEDGFDAVKFVDVEIREKVAGFPAAADLGRCFLAGDSVGGNLAHHVAVRCGGFDFKEVKIRGLVMIQPFFGGEVRTDSETRLGNGGDLTLKRTDFFWKAFLPNGSNRDHLAVNVFGHESSKEDSLSGIEYPNTLVIVGGLDLLQDWQRRYVDGLKRSGKEVELVEFSDAGHGFYGTTEFAEFDMLIAKIGEFVVKHT
ncbi:hypothetical protein RND81_01G221400 [Saponaria officinalis]|uniref:Alpha/beta hydrolase fold-3 domain-containing protein n=1 Tax=Saponaria officinalis TaxID=3572 RepID=A0AAW1NK45_SAPOF